MTLVDQLKEAPTLGPITGQDPEPPRGGHVRQQIRERKARRAAPRQPFAEQTPPTSEPGTEDLDDIERNLPADEIAVGVTFTQEQALQLRVLWDEYQQRQHNAATPKTQMYRCIGTKPDGTLCGAVVEAGTREERIQSGEVIRCPHGPEAPEFGVLFDRERFPRYHHELTPMEPIE